MTVDVVARGIAVQEKALAHFAAEAVCMIAQKMGDKNLLKGLQAIVPANMGADTDHLRALLEPKSGGPGHG